MSDPNLPTIGTLRKESSQEGNSSESETKPSSSRPGAKRRPSRAGTRSVTTLTAAQLERKRANDREAQRAIRQRTKDHIESLERKIAELTESSDSGAKLMEAVQRNEELEQENAILRSKLSHAVAALGCSEDEVPMGNSGGLLTPGLASPNIQMHSRMSPRRASFPAARGGVPPVERQPSIISQAESWPSQSSYSPNAPSTVDAPPSAHSDIPPALGTVRWAPHSHQSAAQVPMQESSIHAGKATMQHPGNYGYFVDHDRPLHYPTQAQAQPQPQQLPYTSNPNPPQHPQEYAPQQMDIQAQSNPNYPQFAPHQTYMQPAPHHTQGMPIMSRQPIDSRHMMYDVPPNMKPNR